jgi:Spy/CpxP family protein refolding chaperone
MRAMTVKTGATLAAAALMITMGLAGAANAQPGPGGGPGGGQGFGDGMGPGGPGGRGPGGPGGPGRMGGPLGGLLALHPDVPFQALNLTDAQREQVRTIMQGHHAEGRALAERAEGAMDGLRKATDDTIDEGAAAQHGQAVGAVIADAAVLRAKVRAEVFAILTPEQQAEANKLQAQRQQRMEQMKQRGEQRRQQRQQPKQQPDQL